MKTLTKTDEELSESEAEELSQDLSIDDYLANDGYDYRTRLPQNSEDEDDEYEAPIVQAKSLYDLLAEQLNLIYLEEEEFTIGEHLIGSIDEDGYLRRPIKAIVHDMAFRYNLSISPEEIEKVLVKIQRFDPPGIGARDLQECLLLQLRRLEQTEFVEIAIEIIDRYFEEFKKKHFTKLKSRLGIDEDTLKDVYLLITRLNPKPGESQSVVKHEYIIPDFILTTRGQQVVIRLNGMNAPELKISRNYVNMYQQFRGMSRDKRKTPAVKETFDFVKKSIEAAQWFIDAIKQRQFTLLHTMEAIAEKQRDFFLSGGDEKRLRPMILKDIAEEIQMDISTVSRVANSKYVQTDFGIYPLKFFFTEGIETEDGMVSNREVKKALEEIIGGESKRKPLSDDKIAVLLKDKGYNIARRTVAKYREQLGVPVARLRKEV